MSKNADYQRKHRQKLKERGYTEVRGLYAPTDKHDEIKTRVRKEIEGGKDD